jgi:hypothetical protein
MITIMIREGHAVPAGDAGQRAPGSVSTFPQECICPAASTNQLPMPLRG